jgi:hypothetical protein
VEVEYAFLADGAQTSSDGKLYVLGGGIDRIFAGQFPATHPIMALVLKIKLHPSECEREHNLELELWDPDGNPIGGKISATFSANRQGGGRDSFVQLVLNILQQQFPRTGDYGFQIVVDGQHKKTVSLYLEQIEGGSKQPPENVSGD